jgi:hypothetical protein
MEYVGDKEWKGVDMPTPHTFPWLGYRNNNWNNGTRQNKTKPKEDNRGVYELL